MIFAPQGLQDSAGRFNAGNIQSNGLALQGREIGPAGRVVVMGRFHGVKTPAEPSCPYGEALFSG